MMKLAPLTRNLTVSVPDRFNINIWYMHNVGNRDTWYDDHGRARMVYSCNHCQGRISDPATMDLGELWKHVRSQHPVPHRDQRTNVYYRNGRRAL